MSKSGLPFSKMAYNDDEKRQIFVQYIHSMIENFDKILIGNRPATHQQKVFLVSETNNKIVMRTRADSADGNVWQLCDGEGEFSGFYWKSHKNSMHYRTQDGKEFKVDFPKPHAEPCFSWEMSGCGKCKEFPASTWHGACMKCERPGCFGAGGEVTLVNGTKCKIEDLQVGDSVASHAGYSVVKDVICREEAVNMCCIENVRLTETHPVLSDGRWCYPNELTNEITSCVEKVWNFVMEGQPDEKSKHTIIVNNMVCATLGCAPCPRLKEKDPQADEDFGTGFWKLYGKCK